MAGLVEQHDDFSWHAECVRRRPTICGRRFRERIRRIACHDQRPVLVRPAKEKILTTLEQLRPAVLAVPRARIRSNCCFVSVKSNLCGGRRAACIPASTSKEPTAASTVSVREIRLIRGYHNLSV